MHVVTLLHCTLKVVKRINFTLCVFYHNYQEKKKAGVVVEATCATTSYSWIKSLVSTL